MRLVHAYFQGGIDVKGGFFLALTVENHQNPIRLSFGYRLGPLLDGVLLLAPNEARSNTGSHWPRRDGSVVKAHSRTESRAAISRVPADR